MGKMMRFSKGSRHFSHIQDYSVENQFAVKTILTENFEPSVSHHHSEQNLEVAWYTLQAIASKFTCTSCYRPTNKYEV